MRRLSDKILLEAYNKAIEQKTSADFLELLKKEIDRRSLDLNNHQPTRHTS